MPSDPGKTGRSSNRKGRRAPVRRGSFRSGVGGIIGIAAVILFALGTALGLGPKSSPSPASTFARTTAQPSTPSTPITGMVTLAPGATPVTGTVDGLPCSASVSVAYHARIHLEIRVDGAPQPVPKGVGIPGTCLYWIHTYSDDGLVDIEAPRPQVFTLGQFFDIWGEPLTATQVGPYPGHAGDARYAFVNGAPWSGDPRQIPLTNGSVVELQLGPAAVAPATYTFRPGS